MSETFRCIVYYNDDGSPQICNNNCRQDCDIDCFEAIVKIIPIERSIEETLNETGEKIKRNIREVSNSIDKVSKEFKKSVGALNKFNKILK